MSDYPTLDNPPSTKPRRITNRAGQIDPSLAYQAGSGVRKAGNVVGESVQGVNDLASMPTRAIVGGAKAVVGAEGRAAGDFWRGMTGGPIEAPVAAPASAPTLANPTTKPAASTTATPQRQPAQPAAVPATAAATAPTLATPPQPSGMTAAQINDGRMGTPGAVPPSGTGAFVNNTTGKVTNLSTPPAQTGTDGQPVASARQYLQQPTLATPPVKQPLGPLPTLQRGGSIFEQMVNLSGQEAAYRDKAELNRQAQGDFNNQRNTFDSNLKVMTDTANANAGISRENRADLALPPAIALQKAETERAKQQTETAAQAESERQQIESLRGQMVNETDPGKLRILQRKLYALQGKTAPKYQVVTEKGVAGDMPTQTTYVVTEDEYGNPVSRRLTDVLVGTSGGKPVYATRVGASGGKHVYEDAQGKRFIAQ